MVYEVRSQKVDPARRAEYVKAYKRAIQPSKEAGFNRLRKNYFTSLCKAGISKTKGMTENNRMIKKASSKARGSEVPGTYSCT